MTTKSATALPRASNELRDDALNASNESVRLAAFASATGCDPREVVAGDGKSLDLWRVFDAMRRRGYHVGEPARPQAQDKPGFVAWIVAIGVQGHTVKLVFYTLEAA